MAEGLLQCMQDHQRRTFHVAVFRDDFCAARLIPRFVDRHDRPSRSVRYCELLRRGIVPESIKLSHAAIAKDNRYKNCYRPIPNCNKRRRYCLRAPVLTASSFATIWDFWPDLAWRKA